MDMDLGMATALLPSMPELDDGTGAYLRGLFDTLAGRRR